MLIKSDESSTGILWLTSAPIGAWESPFWEIMTDKPTDQHTDMRGHWEVTHPKIVVLGKSVEMWNTRALVVCSVPTYRALIVIWVLSEGKILRYWFHRGKLITRYYFILKHCQINVGKIVNKKSKKKEEIEEVVNVRFLNSTGPLDLGEKIVTYHRHFLKCVFNWGKSLL